MPEKKLRLVIDTNIWISFLIGKTLAGLSKAIIDDRVLILFSEELFNEVIEVLHRPMLKNIFLKRQFRNSYR